MNARDRFVAIMNFEKPDRGMLWEFGYWTDTIKRWYKEGLPKTSDLPLFADSTSHIVIHSEVLGEGCPVPREENETLHWDVDVHEHLKFDKGYVAVPLNSWLYPSFQRTILRDDGDHLIIVDEKGIKQKIRKDGNSKPLYLDWPVHEREDFEKIKERFQSRVADRLPANWNQVKEELNNRDYPLALGCYPCGFFGSLRFLMGEVSLFVKFYDEPKLIKDMMNFLADFWVDLWSQVLSEIKVDCVVLWEDMCYNKGPLISPALFKEFIMPCYKKLTGPLRENGVDIIIVDTDGNCWELIPLFMEVGANGMFPFEVQAGMDIREVRGAYPKLRILGGLDKISLSKGKAAIDTEIESKLPFMLKRGGYIPYADHHIPPDVSWENFLYYRNKIKQLSEKI